MKRVLTASVAVAALLAVAAPHRSADAAPVVVGTGAFALANVALGDTGGTPGLIGANDTFSASLAVLLSGTGIFSGLPFLSSVTLTSSLVATVGDNFGFTGALGSFSGNVSSVSASAMPGSNREVTAVIVAGTFTPGALTGGPGVGPTPGSLTFSATQTGGAGSAISASFTLAVLSSNGGGDPDVVPAPASLALFGLALAGLATARRRAQKG